MDLFTNQHTNLLPYDGLVYYFGPVVPIAEADYYLERLVSTIAWKSDEAIIFGKRIVTKRKVALYGDSDYEYKYSNVQKRALPWTAELLQLKALTEKISSETFNACLMNLYHDGYEGVGWHSDAEKDLKNEGAIGSLSFGAERKFMFRHKEKKTTIDIFLEHGSLLVMTGSTQAHWLHRLPPTTRIKSPRVNLTFRTIVT